jgi:hypothetical protein
MQAFLLICVIIFIIISFYDLIFFTYNQVKNQTFFLNYFNLYNKFSLSITSAIFILTFIKLVLPTMTFVTKLLLLFILFIVIFYFKLYINIKIIVAKIIEKTCGELLTYIDFYELGKGPFGLAYLKNEITERWLIVKQIFKYGIIYDKTIKPKKFNSLENINSLLFSILDHLFNIPILYLQRICRYILFSLIGLQIFFYNYFYIYLFIYLIILGLFFYLNYSYYFIFKNNFYII